VQGLSTDAIGTLAAQAAVTVLELAPQSASLEDAYLALTRDTVDYRAEGPADPGLLLQQGAR
jgi:ABC-2 type transport system ATP-binding protein